MWNDKDCAYMVVAHGETEVPEMKLCNSRDEVKQAIREMYDPENDLPEHEITGILSTFDDPDHWSWSGCRWEVRFEIGGFEVTRYYRRASDRPSGEPVHFFRQKAGGSWVELPPEGYEKLRHIETFEFRTLYALDRPSDTEQRIRELEGQNETLSGLLKLSQEALHRMGGESDRPSVAPEGWKLVPVEPTEEMHTAAVRTIVRCNGNDDFPPRVYRAMLEAAPALDRPSVTADCRDSCGYIGAECDFPQCKQPAIDRLSDDKPAAWIYEVPGVRMCVSVSPPNPQYVHPKEVITPLYRHPATDRSSDASESDALHKYLDRKGVPRADENDAVLSLIGRVMRYKSPGVHASSRRCGDGCKGCATCRQESESSDHPSEGKHHEKDADQ